MTILGPTYDLYQAVPVRSVRRGREKWIQGTMVAVKGPSTYLVRVPGNQRRYVHADHLIADDTRGAESKVNGSVPSMEPLVSVNVEPLSGPTLEESIESTPAPQPVADNSSPSPGTRVDNSSPRPSTSVVTPRSTSVRVSRSGRVVKAPAKLDL